MIELGIGLLMIFIGVSWWSFDRKLNAIEDRIYDLQQAVDRIEGGDDGPDDGESEDEPAEPSNVVAIGRKAA